MPVIAAAGGLALVGWLYIAWGMDPVGRAEDVWSLIVVCWLQLSIAGAVFALTRTVGSVRLAVSTVLAFGAVFRLVMVCAGMAPGTSIADLGDELRGRAVVYETHVLYDNDVWRYLWDGAVQKQGLDPYRTSPTGVAESADAGAIPAETLLEDEVWWEVHQRIGYPDYPSVYPPIAQLLFRGLATAAPASVFALKLVLSLADFGVCLLLVALLRRLDKSPMAVVLYAWHPLPIKEIAGSGHVDGLMSVFVVAMVLALLAARPRAAWLAWAAAVATKLVPAALGPVVLVRLHQLGWLRRWRSLREAVIGGTGAIVLLVVVSWPYWAGLPAMLETVGRFADTWRFNAGLWRGVGATAAWLGADQPAQWADLLCRALLIGLILTVTVRVLRRPGDEGALVAAVYTILAAAVLLSPAVMPWYLLWALPFAVALGRWPFIVLGGLAFLSYLVYIDQREHLWWLLAEHGGFVALLLLAFWRRRADPASTVAHGARRPAA